MSDQHVAYMDSRYMYTEDLPDGTSKHHYTEERPVYCGTWSTLEGGTILCDACEAKLKLKYPQGWQHYPGDVCKHGRYVGGVGIDHMCQACESE